MLWCSGVMPLAYPREHHIHDRQELRLGDAPRNIPFIYSPGRYISEKYKIANICVIWSGHGIGYPEQYGLSHKTNHNELWKRVGKTCTSPPRWKLLPVAHTVRDKVWMDRSTFTIHLWKSIQFGQHGNHLVIPHLMVPHAMKHCEQPSTVNSLCGMCLRWPISNPSSWSWPRCTNHYLWCAIRTFDMGWSTLLSTPTSTYHDIAYYTYNLSNLLPDHNIHTFMTLYLRMLRNPLETRYECRRWQRSPPEHTNGYRSVGVCNSHDNLPYDIIRVLDPWDRGEFCCGMG